MMLLSTRLRVWNPDVVVPPSELRCHGRRLMVQSLFAGHVSLHRSHSPISIIGSVESVERDGAEPPLAGASIANSLNCFIQSKRLIAPASGWLERLVRPPES